VAEAPGRRHTDDPGGRAARIGAPSEDTIGDRLGLRLGEVGSEQPGDVPGTVEDQDDAEDDSDDHASSVPAPDGPEPDVGM
jgi:hypothetical protein